MDDGTSTIDGNEWQMHRWALGPHRREGVASCAWCPHGVKQERVDRLGAVVTLWLDVTSSTSLWFKAIEGSVRRVRTSLDSQTSLFGLRLLYAFVLVRTLFSDCTLYIY